jgi:lipopolysaccharide transport system ATP-binding protein
MTVVVKVENVSKRYRLGATGTSTLKGDFQRWWALKRGKEDPFSKVMEESQMKEGDFWALRDINFEIRQGEAVGIIGKNGAGKSTLLKLLSRITLPTTGRIKVKGRIASLLEVGTGFNPELSGRENVYLNGAILGMTKAEVTRKFDEIVDFSGVERFIDTPVKRYSSGMYVRLAFAVAAHLESEILILDEVLAVGDAEFQKKCLGKMDDVAYKQGRTVIFVSHSMQAVKKLCHSGIYLEKGRLLMNSDIQTVIDAYSQSEVVQGMYLREWSKENALSNRRARILKVQISDDDGNLLNKISTDDEFYIDIETEVFREGGYIGLTIIFYDNAGNCVFGSINNQEESFYGKPMSIGTYLSRCKVPANFFNNGSFDLFVNLFSENYTDAKLAENVLRLDINDGFLVRGDYTAGYAGVVRPLLNWNTYSVNSEYLKTT